MMKLSIIIVNYNTYVLTKQTIESILTKSIDFDFEIILIDNASRDGSIDWLNEDYKYYISSEKIKVVINKENLGFSKANNIGIKKSKGDYILLLNSDTSIVGECLTSCVGYIEAHNKTSEKSTIGVLGCKVVLPDGTLDHACKRGFPTPKASLYYLLKLHKKDAVKYGQYDALYLGEDEVGEVDSLMGAFMLMPKRVLDEVGLLDEDFFMYGEDIDLCYRIKEAGYKVIYYPKVQIIHYKGGSSKKRRTKVIYDFHKAMWIFYKKYYYKKYNLGITLCVYMGIWVKYGIEILKNTFK
jgi:GT2 family glycosyltransferase